MLGARDSILLVDDQADNLRVLSAILSQQGYKVRKAISGEMALETLQADLPDLILLDIRMPQIDGYKICSMLKSAPATQDIPIIFLSALDDTVDKIKAFAVGGADYITKPFQAEEVLARIGHQLIIQQQQKQLRAQNQQLQLQMERERILGLITQHMHQSFDLEEILNTTAKEVQQFLRTDWVMIQRLTNSSCFDVIAEAIGSTPLSVFDWILYEENNWYELYQDQQIYVVDDVHADHAPSIYTKLLANSQVKASLTVPIIKGNEVWGRLFAHHCSDTRVWQTWEVELLNHLAVQLAIAIQQSELYQELKLMNQELKRLAETDSLTQIANRRYFDEYFNQQWHRFKRERQPLSLILCDVDYFKLYNDHYGHQAGDECLKRVAQAIVEAVRRPADLVARYGGEEFVVILPNTNLAGACCVAERIQAELTNLQLPHIASDVNHYVTLSMGIASIVPNTTYSSHALLAATDWALYTAKIQGRNTYFSQEIGL